MSPHRNPDRRFDSENLQRWLHGVTVAAVPLLVAYGMVGESEAPLWIALGTAVLAPATALLAPRTTAKPKHTDQL